MWVSAVSDKSRSVMAIANGCLPHAFYIYKSIVLFIIFSNICVFFWSTKCRVCKSFAKFIFCNVFTENIDFIMN